ncbi:MAG: hypothetical protein IKQ35_04795 [Bacilli bacterium]|nr:hypothetical protein [Bacilli bacterium]
MGEKKEIDTLYYEDEIKDKNNLKDIDMTEKEHVLVNTNGVEYDPDDYESNMLEEKSNKKLIIVTTIVIITLLVISLIAILQ